MKDTKLSKLLEDYNVGINFEDTANTRIGDKYWYLLFSMINAYNKMESSLKSVFIRKWMKRHHEMQSLKYSKGSSQFEDPEDAEFYSLLCKLEKEGNIKIPGIIRSFFNPKSNIIIFNFFFKCNVTLKDIEEYLKIGEYIWMYILMEVHCEKYEKELFTVYASSEKKGIARASGNGSMLTLPKEWIGSKVHAFQISRTLKTQ